MNHLKLLVSDMEIKIFLVISIETKEISEIDSIWFLNHVFQNDIFGRKKNKIKNKQKRTALVFKDWELKVE